MGELHSFACLGADCFGIGSRSQLPDAQLQEQLLPDLPSSGGTTTDTQLCPDLTPLVGAQQLCRNWVLLAIADHEVAGLQLPRTSPATKRCKPIQIYQELLKRHFAVVCIRQLAIATSSGELQAILVPHAG